MNRDVSCGCCGCRDATDEHLGAVNRPGLSTIRRRAGTYASFLDAMTRGLANVNGLTTREPDDPAVALLDAWAVAGDVLTFYQERIAAEGYLRTATERRSILELGRLVDYELKPGVAASVHLAYTLDDDAKTTIPAGSKSQSIPRRKDEQAQTFETSEDIEARGEWNAMKPRMSHPQRITTDNVLTIASVWIAGTSATFLPRDPLLFVFDAGGIAEYALRRIVKAVTDTDHDRTELQLEVVRPYYIRLLTAVAQAGAVAPNVTPIADLIAERVSEKSAKMRRGAKKKKAGPARTDVEEATVSSTLPALDPLRRQILLGTPRSVLRGAFHNLSGLVGDALSAEDDDPQKVEPACFVESLAAFLEPLTRSRGVAPVSAFDFSRSLADVRRMGSDSQIRLLSTFRPKLATTLYAALANVCIGERPYEQLRGIFVLRRRASVFGYNAPVLIESDDSNVQAFTEQNQLLNLDTPDEAVTTGSYVVTRNDFGTRVSTVTEAETAPLTAYAISGRSTRLTLSTAWADGLGDDLNVNLPVIRRTSVLAESEELKLAQQPLARPVGRRADEDPADETSESETRIELDRVVEGLAPGHRVIVRGKRVDTGGTHGIAGAELAMIDNVEQHTDAGPGGSAHSVLILAPKGLAFRYERASVEILGNVAPATHGESRFEIVGGGDASKAMQTFTLRHAPLTFVSAPTVHGVRSTLAVRVDDVLWHETDTLAGTRPTDRVFVTRTADDGKVSITFGDGRRGQRLFTGQDNVRAAYRNGIGRAGNVQAGQVATAVSREAGVRDVVNPLEASGGADPESRDEARRNIPVSLQAMGRVVSVGDFADFAHTFGGIAKASAALLSDGRRRFVHLTIGGTGDIDIDPTSDLYRNLVAALRKYGDPYQPFVVDVRQKLVMTGSARVRVGADSLWSLVAPKIRAALLDTFSYDRRDFGQPIYAAEVITAIQSVPGVAYVDLDELAGIRWEDVVREQSPAAAATAFLGLGGIVVPPIVTSSGASPVPATASPCDSPAILPHYACVAGGRVHPAEIAYLPPELADLFILTEIKHD